MRDIYVLQLIAFCLLGCSSGATKQVATAPKFHLEGGSDLNGFKLNPQWSGQIGGDCLLDTAICNAIPVPPGCTQRHHSIDTAPRTLRSWLRPKNWPKATCYLTSKGIPGHLNFDFATFHGLLGWEGLAFDGDYGFSLQPVQGGITLGNLNGEEPPGIKVEFSSLESINRADDLTPWWTQFRKLAIESRNREPVISFLVGENQSEAPLAIVTGLLGLDCVHECHSELHPVYGLAIRVRNEIDNEKWVVFVRNWGNQGWCSQKNHPLTKDKRVVTELRLLLPNPQAMDAEIVSSAFKSYKTKRSSPLRWIRRNPGEATGHAPVIVPGEGVVLGFDLPDPRERTMVLGELEIQWTPRKQERDRPALFACPTSRTVARTPDPEERYDNLLNRLSQEEWENYRAELADDPKAKVKGVEVQLPRAVRYPSLAALPMGRRVDVDEEITVTGEGSSSSRSNRPVRVRARRDREKIRVDQRLVSELCEAAGDLAGDPDFEDLCGKQ